MQFLKKPTITEAVSLRRLRWLDVYREWNKIEIPKRVLDINLETTRLRGRSRSIWKDEVREDGRIVGGEEWQEKIYNRGREEAPENSKESSHSAHAVGMNE
jgi:hypothetical protein